MRKKFGKSEDIKENSAKTKIIDKFHNVIFDFFLLRFYLKKENRVVPSISTQLWFFLFFLIFQNPKPKVIRKLVRQLVHNFSILIIKKCPKDPRNYVQCYLTIILSPSTFQIIIGESENRHSFAQAKENWIKKKEVESFPKTFFLTQTWEKVVPENCAIWKFSVNATLYIIINSLSESFRL